MQNLTKIQPFIYLFENDENLFQKKKRIKHQKQAR